MILIYSRSRELNIMGSGEEAAQALGVDTHRLSQELFISSSLLVGLVVAFTGSIAFVGLVVPHIVRLNIGPDHRVVLPASFILGAILILGSDLIARSVAPVELPLSVVTSIFGVPYFIYLMRTRL
jgi:iron complex transport system permease protein